MKIKFTLALLAVLFFGVLCGAALTPRGIASDDKASAHTQPLKALPETLAAEDPTQAPSVAMEGAAAAPVTIGIPGVPQGSCCIWQLEKRMDGNRTAQYSPPYQCPINLTPTAPVTPTMQGKMTIDLALTSGGAQCDPLAQLIPNGSRLRAFGRVIRRSDAFAHFNGNFTINNPAGTALFRGHIETTDRLGSHHLFLNCEQCNPISHFEGWIVGQGIGALANYTIRAQVTSRGTVPSPQQASTPATGSLAGVFIRCP